MDAKKQAWTTAHSVFFWVGVILSAFGLYKLFKQNIPINNRLISMSKHWVTPSRSSPKPGGNRACLCKNGKYSRKCCDGSLQAQGVGNVTGVQVQQN